MLRTVLNIRIHRPWGASPPCCASTRRARRAVLLVLAALAVALALLAAPRRARALDPVQWEEPDLALAAPPVQREPEATVTGPAEAAEPPWWNAGFQSTYVFQRKPSFHAPYSGPKSLLPGAENGYTLTATLFATV